MVVNIFQLFFVFRSTVKALPVILFTEFVSIRIRIGLQTTIEYGMFHAPYSSHVSSSPFYFYVLFAVHCFWMLNAEFGTFRIVSTNRTNKLWTTLKKMIKKNLRHDPDSKHKLFRCIWLKQCTTLATKHRKQNQTATKQWNEKKK